MRIEMAQKQTARTFHEAMIIGDALEMYARSLARRYGEGDRNVTSGDILRVESLTSGYARAREQFDVIDDLQAARRKAFREAVEAAAAPSAEG